MFDEVLNTHLIQNTQIRNATLNNRYTVLLKSFMNGFKEKETFYSKKGRHLEFASFLLFLFLN